MMFAPIAGAILAGGQSSRMAGHNKAFVSLSGRPLIQHVIDRVRPQVDALAISVESQSPAFEGLGLTQLPDPMPGHHGPLGGLLAALRHFASSHEWVLVVPCDAPFVPLDLAKVLHSRVTDAAASCAVIVYEGEEQPTFSIWRSDLLPDLEVAVGRGGLSGLKQFMQTLRFARCHWQVSEPPPFFNINDRSALDRAGSWLQSADETEFKCLA
jgi:molybdopterin-guanine dinucleotide biosynthesis protein A